MRGLSVMSFALGVGLIIMGGNASAQSLREMRGPAEIPPASYSANQYIDSKGCVFIRAGSGGATQWIPRVNRDRTVMCGQRPSAASQSSVQTAAPAAPAVRSVAAPQPRAAQVTVAPQRVVVAQAPATQTTTSQRCAFLSPNGGCAATTWPNGQRAVRSGAVIARPVIAQNSTQAGASTGTAIRTQRVIVTRELTHGTGNDPSQYRLTWSDGRLNPLRGLPSNQARSGSGQSVTGQSWYLPRHSAHQHAQAPVVSTHAPRVSVSTRGSGNATMQRATQARAASSGHAYVQVGTFGVQANAQKTIARLQAMGLPARVQASGAYQIVLAGPFGDRATVQSALNAARRAGFADAFSR